MKASLPTLSEPFGKSESYHPAGLAGGTFDSPPAFAVGTALASGTSTASIHRVASRTSTNTSSFRWIALAIAGDLAFAAIGSLLAFYVRFHTFVRDLGVYEALSMRQYMGHMVLGSLSLVMVLGWMGVYQKSSLLRPRWVADRILKGVLAWTIGFLTFTLAFKLQPPISRVYTALNGVCTFTLIEIWRSYLCHLLRRPKSLKALQQRVLFVGWSTDAERLHRTLSNDPFSALNIIGMVNPEPATAADTTATKRPPLLGSTSEVESLLARHEVDMVIVADFYGQRDELTSLANICEREMVQFKVIPSCFRIFVSGLHLETMSGTPILGVDRLPLDNPLNWAIKRATDIVGALVGLVLSAPIVGLFGLLVWLESRGAIFYRQRRTGIFGKSFDIFKIRSMKLDAEAGKGAQWCQENDPRRLRIGAFMRKYNIDEVPQFWNVLKGEMSLVGPRPERPELIQNFKHNIPHYNARHHAKPGMTGWAQINGLRGDTDLSERIKYDLWYMENWSLFLDFQIMFMTFFKRANAY
jgi:exopolysaccharide biosynthesis polyprenyl glycosylphosphotransferase